MLWLKSRNSEVWLDRRTTYTRSTAVLSMVGYLLGLGDRHPSNLMLDRCRPLCPRPSLRPFTQSARCMPQDQEAAALVGYLLGLADRHPSNLVLDRCRLGRPIAWSWARWLLATRWPGAGTACTACVGAVDSAGCLLGPRHRHPTTLTLDTCRPTVPAENACCLARRLHRPTARTDCQPRRAGWMHMCVEGRTSHVHRSTDP